ncbi:sugar transferase [Rhabdothermincola salaria]|uniref:sugar transferase n=1 Tax=Rhabdothermincola salaria TaxID=2903142 RepID=UPI001E31D9B8|nr:sugar transferase [Rhabdothermincola salaria]MCD9622742.1 sugar transferase [Rhabdothermincola salaria]
MSRAVETPTLGPRPVRRRRRRGALAVKRLLDLAGASVMLVVLSPLMAAIAVAILASSGRPVLFRQVRVGQDGRLFTMLKFRTMVCGAEHHQPALLDRNERLGPLFKMADDPRVTRIGRWLRHSSLDELPQLLNVIAGDMSLVGPRPALPAEDAQFPAQLHRRVEMPQGITGLWQLDGRNDADFGKYTELDLRYVEQWSLALDLQILARTPHVVWRQMRARADEAPDVVDLTDPANTGDADPTRTDGPAATFAAEPSSLT